MAELRRCIGARQARFGVFDDGDERRSADPWRLPWTLRESFGEYTLSRELAQPGELVEVVPDGLSQRELHDLLARHEGRPSLAEQEAEIARLDTEYERREAGLCIACGERPVEMGVECGPCYREGDRRQGIRTYD